VATAAFMSEIWLLNTPSVKADSSVLLAINSTY
jgi:hypothetical protein